MVWKRTFLILICVGTVLATAIFFTYRDEAPYIHAVEYYSRDPAPERIQEKATYDSGNHLNNRQLIQGMFSAPALFHVTEPNQKSEPRIFKKEETIRLATKKDLYHQNLYTSGNSFHVTVTHKNDTIKSSSVALDAAKPVGRNCLFQWNDRDPDGWRDLPFSVSKGETASKKERIIFNRVGKCGSRSMIHLLQDLAQKNNFNLISSLVYNKTHVPKSWEEHIVSVLDRVQTPYMFQRHLHFINFQKYKASEVMYINIIREPIPRLVSQYYYARFGDSVHDMKRQKENWRLSQEEYSETVDGCVRNKHRDCSGHKCFYIIPFFCGNNKRCTQSSRWALQRAIYNVENNFLVVGILEEFELTLKVLERMLPGYFRGATDLYNTKSMSVNVSKTSTSLKIMPSNETLAILRLNMNYEYQFYNFIKARLHQQKEILRL